MAAGELVVSRLPTLVASSVVRGARLGESHGGVYLVDLERGSVELKLDWNRTDIDVSGRGGDRGLRGIAFHDERILIAANAELLILDQEFRVQESFTNPFLRHCHEICVNGDRVFLTSTGFDSILGFDLRLRRFVLGLHLSAENESLNLRPYDPCGSAGPPAGHRFHLNSITASATSIWFSGLNTPGLLRMDGRGFGLAALLPRGTHNAQVLEEGVLYNDTAADRVCFERAGTTTTMPVPSYDRSEIVNIDRFESIVARPGFARGLCVISDGLVAGGSSPSTISLYDLHAGKRVAQQNVSMDVRNAVHGLAVWPYS